MEINKKLIKYNFSSRNGKGIKYIVVHDTGNTKAGSGALNHYIYFNGGNRKASSHYFIDDKEIIQTVDDENASWHCGDGKGVYGITNSNSIGIEICVNEDGDYKKAQMKAIELIRHLMKIHHIPKENVIRHFDASRKICPKSMSAVGWREWTLFYDKI